MGAYPKTRVATHGGLVMLAQRSRNSLGVARKGLRLFLLNLYKDRTYWLLLAPMIIYYLVFRYIPLIGNVIAFQDYNYQAGLFHSPLVGFKNFGYLFKSGELPIVLRNTLLYNAGWQILGLLLCVSMAVFLSEIRFVLFKKVAQSAMLLPYFISFVIVGVFVYNIFNYEYGVLNSILTSLGLEKTNVYDNPVAWILILTAASMWKSLGYGTIVYLAAITAIDKELYEAAWVDGAGLWKQVFHITIPLLVPTIIIILLLNIGGMLSGQFELFYQVTGGNANLAPTTEVLDTYVFKALVQNFDMGLAATAGLFQSVFGLVLVIISNTLVRKFNQENSLF